MQLAEGGSWRFGHSRGVVLHQALFVRDALELPVAHAREVPPHLVLDVPDLTAALPAERRERAGREWLRWWRALVALEVGEAADDPGPGRQPSPGRRAAASGERTPDGADLPGTTVLGGAPDLRAAVLAAWAPSRRFAREPDLLARTDPEVFRWEVVRDASEQVAAEHGVPVGALDGAAVVLLVDGPWTFAPRPGVVLCSVAQARDPVEAAVIVREAYRGRLGRATP